jgi:carbon storage regulator
MAADLTRTGSGPRMTTPSEDCVRTGPPTGCLCPDNLIELSWHKEGCHLMLVLTRKSNQSIMIGDEIEISVLSIMGEKVRIGIQAPRDIPVFRKEVYLEIQAERGQVTAGGEVDAALRKLSS